jgi:hypothetical protein
LRASSVWCCAVRCGESRPHVRTNAGAKRCMVLCGVVVSIALRCNRGGAGGRTGRRMGGPVACRQFAGRVPNARSLSYVCDEKLSCVLIHSFAWSALLGAIPRELARARGIPPPSSSGCGEEMCEKSCRGDPSTPGWGVGPLLVTAQAKRSLSLSRRGKCANTTHTQTHTHTPALDFDKQISPQRF